LAFILAAVTRVTSNGVVNVSVNVITKVKKLSGRLLVALSALAALRFAALLPL
jgi:hypothetical protein